MSAAPNVPTPLARGTVLEVMAPDVTRVYSEALLNAAFKENQVDAVLDELDAIVEHVLTPHPQFSDLLASPALSMHDKDRVLVETFEGRALPAVVRFLRVLNQHGRLNLLAAITHQARALWDRRQNRRRVTVRSSVALDASEQAALLERLTRLTSATPIIRFEVDTALIGGLFVQIGDDVYDASVRNKLDQLRRSLIEGKTHEIQSRRDHFSYPA